MQTGAHILYVYKYLSVHTGSPRALIDLIANLDTKSFRPCLLVPHEGDLSKFLQERGTRVFVKQSLSLSKSNVLQFLFSVAGFLLFLR